MLENYLLQLFKGVALTQPGLTNGLTEGQTDMLKTRYLPLYTSCIGYTWRFFIFIAVRLFIWECVGFFLFLSSSFFHDKFWNGSCLIRPPNGYSGVLTQRCSNAWPTFRNGLLVVVEYTKSVQHWTTVYEVSWKHTNLDSLMYIH